VKLGWAILFAITLLAVQRGEGQEPAFEVASVRLTTAGNSCITSISPWGTGRFTATCVSFDVLIELAFGVHPNQISGLEKLGTQYYDVNARPEGDVALTYDEVKPRLRELLAQRFQLATHRETKEFQGYAMVLAKGGLKLHPGTLPPLSPGQPFTAEDQLYAASVNLDVLAGMLTTLTHRPVINGTGIRGTYEVKLRFRPEAAIDSPLPSLFLALEEQAGLKLQTQKVPVEMLVIDQVEKVPTDN
jgi:uncharacterized protein (TIGR03435 family)